MLLLDDLREQFAAFLLTDPKAKWRMDAALVHVITLAYEQGLRDGRMDDSNREPDNSTEGRSPASTKEKS